MKAHPAVRLATPLIVGLLAVAGVSAPSYAQPAGKIEKPATVYRASAKEAKAMLEKAVAYLTDNPAERAFAAFNNQKGAFIRNDLYVFVVGVDDGIMHAHGGAPEGLVGMDVRDLRDASGKPIIRDMLDVSTKEGIASVEYLWLNRQTNRLESKTTLVKRVGKYLVGVGYYVPRSTAEQAKSMLERAVAEVKASPEKAFPEFNAAKGRFVNDDLYVFAVGIDDGKFYAMGANPGMVGADVGDLRDAAGKSIIKDMIALAKEKGSATYDYVWRNPANNKVENKHSLIERVGNYVIGVGYYSK